ncbi:hypothetical protein H0H81_006599 [Sphagnurus paluster]|uniref:Phosphatidylinositol-specific phospholipase C X domain-containing protein n=1 Tax=Sphagnurus paluster TaxID=117069 RepID=A0A9P7GS60_9AGAR|nr:hypothetical protein H0H81_006599 [Sphagnurus paluster]
MPDTLPLSSLCLPGMLKAIESGTFQITYTLIFNRNARYSGIRVIDIRLAIVDSKLIAYHGIYPQRTPFQEILRNVHDFLTAPATCRECIVMSIKQEDFAKTSTLDFSLLVHEEIFKGPGGREMWYLKNRIPCLGEVRGKVILFSRFGRDGEGWEGGREGLGIHPLRWPDSEKSGFSWQCKDTLVRTHDWYNLPSFLAIPEKFRLASQILLPPVNSPPMPTLSITYMSAASFPLALPPTVAKGVGWPSLRLGVEGINSRFAAWLLNHFTRENGDTPGDKKGGEGPRIRGWVLMDYYDQPTAALTPLLVECNYRGRKRGEEGW